MIEGLRRLEYRGYDSAGIALVHDGRAGRPTSGPASWPTSRRRSTRHPLPESTTGIGHTRWATHGAADRRQRPPAPGPHRPGRGRAQRHHRELRRSCAPSSRPTASRVRSETDTEVAAHLLEREVRGGADLTDGDAARSASGSRAPSPSSRSTPRTRTAWWPPAATPRSWSGWARARTSSAPTSPRSSSTPATRSSSARTRSSRSPATGVEVTDFDGVAGRGRRAYHVDWDLSAAEKDGYDWFMRKEIFEQPHAVADALLGRHDERAASCSSTRCGIDRGRAARRRQDHHHRAAARRSTPGWSRSTPSSTGPASPARSSSPTSSATATRS